MPSPIVHSWLPASCAFIVEGGASLTKKEKVRLLLVSIFLANSPDWDFIPGLIFREHLSEIHRNWGHNIFSAFILILIGKKLLTRFVSEKKFKGIEGWFLAAPLVLSHLLLDALGHFNPMGFSPHIPLFWPLSSYRFTLPLKFFVTVQHPSPITILKIEFWKWWFLGELIPSVGLFLIFYAILLLRKSKLMAPDRSPTTFVTDLILPKTQSTVNNTGKS